MYIRNIMTTNVVTIPSSTSVAEARRIMEAHGFGRLPVVDKGKLVGMVTRRRLDQVSPSKATSLTMWELSYLLSKTTVKEIMVRDVLTITPDTTVEESVTLAQSHKVGALVVVEGGKVVGISTTTDLFYKMVNPLLGIGEPGNRIEIIGGGEGKALEDIISLINKLGLRIVTLHVITPPGATKKKLVVHLDSEDIMPLIADLKSQGYEVNVRKR
jgi:acetoin utilization protein AcuB